VAFASHTRVPSPGATGELLGAVDLATIVVVVMASVVGLIRLRMGVSKTKCCIYGEALDHQIE
jgi:hypothetical protein